MSIKIFIKARGCLIALGIVVISLIVLIFFAIDDRLEITNYELTSSKLANPIKLAVLTDLHSCYYGAGQKELIDAIEAGEPDVILLVGDILDHKKPHTNTIILLEAISPKYPCYYVTGNHEYWSGEVVAIKKMLRKHEVVVLEGNFEMIKIGDTYINICGVDDPSVNRSQEAGKSLHRQLKDLETVNNGSIYTVMLSHHPELGNSYLQHPFDLILAGHAHGGQVRIPWLLDGLYAPNQGFFPQYTSGIYNDPDMNMTMIVSRGLAKESDRFPRIFNRPELVFVTLNPAY